MGINLKKYILIELIVMYWECTCECILMLDLNYIG